MALDSAWWSACAALSLDVSLSPGFSLQLYTATYDVYISNPQNANSPAFLYFFFFWNVTILLITRLENLENFLSFVPHVHQLFKITKYWQYLPCLLIVYDLSLLIVQIFPSFRLFRLLTLSSSLLYFIQTTFQVFPFSNNAFPSIYTAQMLPFL